MLQLALKLGYGSPARMLRELRPSELGMWAALWGIDPWGEERADLRAGITSSVIANVNRDTRQKAEPYSPRDFMPYRQLTKVEQQAELSRTIRAGLLSASAVKKANKKP